MAEPSESGAYMAYGVEMGKNAAGGATCSRRKMKFARIALCLEIYIYLVIQIFQV